MSGNAPERVPRVTSGLQRFVDAQDGGGTYARALAELRAGRKRSHWIWFVLPQLAGLGRSSTAQHYGLAGLDEARAYLAHPVLGPRLRETVAVLAGLQDDAETVLGGIDAVKARSCLTLFAHVDADEPLFRQVLDAWYGGVEDPATLALL